MSRRINQTTDEWMTVKLGELGSFSKGKGIRKDDVVADGIPCVRYGELYTHHHYQIKKINSFITRETANESYRISTGDILFAGSGETKEEIGKCAVFLNDKETYAGGDVIVFSPRKTDPLFLAYLLNQESVTKQKAQFGQGDAVVHIYPNNLKDLILKIPSSISEQTAIATALSDADALITALEKLIKKKLNIKQGVMQVLLRPKKGWSLTRIGDLGKTYGGLSGKSREDFVNGTHPYIPFMNIMSNVIIDTEYVDHVKVRPNESQNRAQKGDLFFNGSSETPEEVGMCSVLQDEIPNLLLNSFCFGFRLYDQPKTDGLFLSYFFEVTREESYFSR